MKLGLRYFKRNYNKIGQDNHSSLSGLSGAVVSGTVRRPQSTILTCFDGDPLLLPHLACTVSIIFYSNSFLLKFAFISNFYNLKIIGVST